MKIALILNFAVATILSLTDSEKSTEITFLGNSFNHFVHSLEIKREGFCKLHELQILIKSAVEKPVPLEQVQTLRDIIKTLKELILLIKDNEMDKKAINEEAKQLEKILADRELNGIKDKLIDFREKIKDLWEKMPKNDGLLKKGHTVFYDIKTNVTKIKHFIVAYNLEAKEKYFNEYSLKDLENDIKLIEEQLLNARKKVRDFRKNFKRLKSQPSELSKYMDDLKSIFQEIRETLLLMTRDLKEMANELRSKMLLDIDGEFGEKNMTTLLKNLKEYIKHNKSSIVKSCDLYRLAHDAMKPSNFDVQTTDGCIRNIEVKTQNARSLFSFIENVFTMLP